MSYILKALRKSEAERARGAVPGLATQHAVAARARGPLWPWVVAGALVVNAAVVISGVWRPEILFPGAGRPAELGAMAVARPAPPTQAMPGPARTAAPPEAVPQPPPLEPEDGARPTPSTAPRTAPGDSPAEAVAVETAASPSPGTRSAAAPKPSADGQGSATRRAPEGARTAAPRAKARAPQRKPAAIQGPAVPGPPAGPREPAGAATEKAAPAGPDLALRVAEPEPPSAEAPPELDPYASVPMLWQLPSSIRSKVPDLSLTVHVYAPEPSSRFVIVGRRKHREGDALASGLKLEAIVPDGIVLDYEGRTFKLSN